jgi:hypothetical protein
VSLLLLFPSPAIHGSGDLSLPTLQLAGSGTETFTGSGDLRPVTLQLAGTGTETFSGSGDIQPVTLQLAGSGTETFASTGDLSLGTLALSGAGLEIEAGSGDLTLSVTLGGSGGQTFGGSGDTSFAPLQSGTGTETFAGTGDLSPAGPALSGTDSVAITGSGDLALSNVADAGAGTVSDLPRGVLQARYPELPLSDFDKPKPRARSGTGALAPQGPTLGGGDLSIDAPRITTIARLLAPVRGVGACDGPRLGAAGDALLSYDGRGALDVMHVLADARGTASLSPQLAALLGLITDDELEAIPV